MTSRIISVESAPSCTPKLPPVRRTGAGALQLPGIRHEAKPLPYSPPTTNAAFFISGTITMHRAFSRSFKGMPPVRLVATSRRVSALRCRRLSGVSSCASTSGAKSNWQAIEIETTEIEPTKALGQSIAIVALYRVGLASLIGVTITEHFRAGLRTPEWRDRMYCTKCGVELREDDRFCSRCGNRTAAAPAPEMPRALML